MSTIANLDQAARWQSESRRNAEDIQEKSSEIEYEAALQAWKKKCDEIAMAGFKKDSKLADMSAPPS